ncbi:hypothetical protein [Fontibacter flavus]|uniref:Uncharacterized protein n=1 Tax=Fontibacter flavus TaxID=654838 RepID=A0ABV6FU55_9BACT
MENIAYLIFYAYMAVGAILLLGSVFKSKDLIKIGQILGIGITAIFMIGYLFMAWAPIVLVLGVFAILIFAGKLFS